MYKSQRHCLNTDRGKKEETKKKINSFSVEIKSIYISIDIEKDDL